MASRQLRKLRQQQELFNAAAESSQASEESEEEYVPAPRKNAFPGFAALADNEDDDDEPKSDEDEAKADQTLGLASEEVEEAAPAKKSKKSKKKKKKKKKATKFEVAEPEQKKDDFLDDIDRALEELKLKNPQANAAGSSAASLVAPGGSPPNELSELFRINFQHLKAMNEMRKLFGNAMGTVDAEDPQGNRLGGGGREVDLETFLNTAPNPYSGRPSVHEAVLRLNPFIEGKRTWPRDSALGLKMECLQKQTDDGFAEFTFAHTKAYEDLEDSFFGLVQSYDSMQMVYFLQRHPYHISSLIQVSKIARNDQNSSLAADLIERALFSFGRVSLTDFRKKLEQGRVRIDFARPENRQFYLAGYNMIKLLVLKGTCRTALEWAKLFLGLNRQDPYGMLNWIHVLAIRAYEGQWFIDLCASSLLNPPPTATTTNGLTAAAPYIKQTLALAHLQLNSPAAARACITSGIAQLPWLYYALFTSLSLDAPPSVWAILPRDADEELHTKLYVHMAKDLWNNPLAISALTDAANAGPRPDADALPRGPSVALATARFVYLDNTPELMAAVPRKMLHVQPNFDFDPLPPPREENVFSSEAQKKPWVMAEEEGVEGMVARLAAMARAHMEAAQQQQQQQERERGGDERRAWVEDVEDEGEAPLPGMMGRVLNRLFGRWGSDDGGSGTSTPVGEAPWEEGGRRLPGGWDAEFDGHDEGEQQGDGAAR
ncbi:transcriptional repressor TCF25-domain-containing protein [Bombardia bombarda]|uniref:Transcriptional repressor TCF25-domain-containing protein n=1 Tax=Bombardia bombarda TaxID=252184 RepID=A0AA40CDN6_9PEZI|nr:transcriptional repressor TCF25-domain-containing protein [Bombardia bombarda]